MHLRASIAPSLVALALAITACGPDNEAVFEAQISAAESPACAADSFPLEPTLFAATRTHNGAMFRMQTTAQARIRTDAFYVVVVETHDVLENCPAIDALAGSTVAVGPDQCVQAFFRLNRECAREYLNPHVQGTVTFSEVGFASGDRVEGTVDGGLVNFKTAEVGGVMTSSMAPLGTISGSFSFEVEVGPAWQVYATPSGPVENP